MPLQKLQFRPGLNREGTDYSNEGGWYDGDKVRFRSGFPEKIGGWTKFSNNNYVGVCRDLWNWVDLSSNNYIGVGTSKKYYIEAGGAYNDITPIYTTTTLSGTAISTTASSTTVTITDLAYSPNVGDYLIVSGGSSVGGVLLSGEYTVATIGTNNTYTVISTTTATSTATGGGSPIIQYEYPIGLDVETSGNGWGAGAWSPTTPVNLGTNPFVTTSGSGTVVVSQAAHGFTATGQYVSFYGATSLTGTGVFSGMINNTFAITTLTASTYSIPLPSSFVATATTTSGGSSVVAYPQYGTRGWGTAATTGVAQQLRLWSSDNFGQNLLIAPRGGSIYYWIDATGVSTRAQSLSTLSTNASYSGSYVPSATLQVISSAIQRFVIAFGANSYVSGTPNTPFNPLLVRWSDQGNEYQWVPAVTNQSGEFALTNGSYIMGARATRQEILVWTDSALYSMQYLGAPYVWGFQILMDNISVISPNAMVTVNNVTYWMGTGKFYMYSGRVETLPCSLRQYIYDDINFNEAYQIFAGANEAYNEVWWFYVSNSSGGTQIDKYVVYNYLDRVWYYGSMSRTAWLETGIQQYPIAAQFTPSASFSGNIVNNTLTVTNISSGTITVNATIVGSGIQSGTIITSYLTGSGGVGTYTVNNSQTITTEPITISGGAGQLLYHENGTDDVSGPTALPIDSYVQSSDFDIGDGHNFGFVWRILPDVNFNGSNVDQPTVTMTVRPRENSGTPYGVADNPSVQSAQNYQTYPQYTVQQFTGQVYTRLRGRQMAFRIESNQLGVAWQLGSPRIDVRPDGRR